MRFFIPATLALAQVFGFATAQTATGSSDASALMASLATLPECALTCVSKAMPVSSCAFGDLACYCTDPAYANATSGCILTTCTIKEALTTQRWNSENCHLPEPNNGPTTLIVGWTLFSISTICVFLRILARTKFLQGKLGWDDYTIIVVWIFSVPSMAVINLMVNNGLGKNLWMVEFDGITNVLFYFFVDEYFYLITVMLTKISIVLLYLRVIPDTVSVRFRWICFILIGGMVGNCIGCIFGLTFQASPVSYAWTLWSGETKGTTVNLKAQQWAFSLLNVFWDVVVFCLPIPRLLKLHVPDVRKKIMIIFTFMLGLLGTICTCVRLRYLTQWAEVANLTFQYNKIAIWSVVEGYVGIICACMPAIAGPFLNLLTKVVGSLGSTFSKSRSKYSSNHDTNRSGLSGATRVPSSTSHSNSDVELAHKDGGISKTVEASMSMYNIPNDARSDDDVELVSRDYAAQGTGRHEKLSGHEYNGQWR